ncbi:hypothetical protein BU24DRAFT_451570 [Aaosphaeria arxii CBS 175.79]|uniref:Zn(2)-C6 fungal-type domain-containing protein n=1 Tax=Aaosphaeria arxii CBS 175.79 TaxID=1450172 RepID=A0A6A5XN56_9PLEO|nr:uncharacterized protein BU24DRAFT_451570 [Aaosphaeria arxii CBS 175.79]KAF2014562.1 hypothetical protein BU24DRAFT_451570 [Aaosphaeria arxii CBS 175.79]
MTPDPKPAANRNPRPLAPKTAEVQKTGEEDGIKRKQPKSRNGCLTCKAKRMKCDEAKPSCQQCTRRGIPCGGYKKDLKWKAFGQPRAQNPNPASRPSGASKSNAERSNDQSLPLGSPTSGNVNEAFGRMSGNNPINIPSQSSHHQRQPSGSLPHQASTNSNPPSERLVTPIDQRSNGSWNFSPNATWLDSDVLLAGLAEDVDLGDQQHVSPLNDLEFLDRETSREAQDHFDWRSYGFDTFDALLEQAAPSPLVTQDDFHMDDIPNFNVPPRPLWRPPPRSASVNEQDWNEIFRQPQFQNATPEIISTVFHQYTSRILSIEDDDGVNPWKEYVWPLAKEYPALYHAVAAMTCYHMSRAQPDLRTQAIGHVQCSMENLAANIDSGTISLDAALAASLALAWAEAWDCTRPTGKHHIDGARALVKQARDTPNRSPLLDFLISDFLYMDVIARLTSTFEDTSLSRQIDYFPDPSENGPHSDSLMGFACTLFPIIGAVGDIVGCIRARNMKRNSPAIISRAIELKKAIERWSPQVNLSGVDNPSSTVSDSIQTAEAYRWATLLLLQQAVPELPDKSSYWQLGQKVLVFLATIPLSSTTLVTHHFPLMQAGCEATEEEDREWVKERWATMGKRMITGVVERCFSITEEAWRRKDEYAARKGFCSRTGAKVSPHLSSIAADTTAGLNRLDPMRLVGEDYATQMENYDNRLRRGSKAARSASPDFPISSVFNTGIDPITRSGSVDYTVQGQLHWLGVMKDFGWEVMLG